MGYLPLPGDLSALEPAKPGVWKALSPGANDALYRQFANGRQHEVCNWMVPVMIRILFAPPARST